MAMAWQLGRADSGIVRARGSAVAKEWRRFERMLGPIGQRALDALGLTAGERVLDLGCGAGGSAMAAAHRTTKSGCVIGIDSDRAALEVARARAREQLLSWTSFAEAEPESAKLPSSAFDAALSRFGLSQLTEPARALARIGRALRSGGRLSLLAWREPRENLWFELPRAVIADCFGSPLLASDLAFAPRHADPLRELVACAGFRDVVVERLDFEAWVGDDVDEAVEFFFETEGRWLDDRLAPKQFGELTAALRRAYATHDRPAGVWLPASAWLVTARAVAAAA